MDHILTYLLQNGALWVIFWCIMRFERWVNLTHILHGNSTGTTAILKLVSSEWIHDYWTYVLKKTARYGRVSCCIDGIWRTIDAHYNDVIMGAIASQITSLTIVYSTVYSDADQGKHQSSASLAFVRGVHRWPVNSPHKWPVTRKRFPFGDVIMDVKDVDQNMKKNNTDSTRDLVN